MKILFFISVHGHGRGGHFHSLNHISKKIGERHNVKIISLGPGKSNIIESNPHFLRHISFNGLNFLKLRTSIKQEASIFKPDIFHCFDEGSYNIIRLIIPSNKKKLVLNKCGGPNPTHFPHVKNLILFSLENQAWFQKQDKFKDTNIYLIPNRVTALKLNPDFNPIEKNSKEFIFMRICRIGPTYKKSIQDSINLVSTLLETKCKNVRLYIIGVVQDTSVFEELKKHKLFKSGHLTFLTEPKYTDEASKMLYLADAVIGTGRGLMEAASLSKPLLAIDKNRDIPVLLNASYFHDAFKTNFSERNTFTKFNQHENLDNIIKLVQNKSVYKEISVFSTNVFEKFFSLDKVVKSYSQAYSQCLKGKRKLVPDSIFIIRSLFTFHKSSLTNKKIK